jgi:hypothetical protein
VHASIPRQKQTTRSHSRVREASLGLRVAFAMRLVGDALLPGVTPRRRCGRRMPVDHPPNASRALPVETRSASRQLLEKAITSERGITTSWR